MFISGVSDVKSSSSLDQFAVLCYLNVNRPKTIHKSVKFRAFRNIPVPDYRNDVKVLMCNRRKRQKNIDDLINNYIQCYPIDIILEKICIKFIWGLMNSEHILFNNIIKFSLFNMSTTIGENIKYFMYKYNITMSDWYNSFSCIDKKNRCLC